MIREVHQAASAYSVDGDAYHAPDESLLSAGAAQGRPADVLAVDLWPGLLGGVLRSGLTPGRTDRARAWQHFDTENFGSVPAVSARYY